MTTKSLWRKTATTSDSFPSIDSSIKTDIAIIGGGITGVTLAYQLSKEKKEVVLIESNQIGHGSTGDSTGNLYVPVQSYYHRIISKFNLETAKLIAASRQFAIDYIEEIVKTENLSCLFKRRPWYLYTNQDVKEFNKEIDALKKLQLPIELISNLPIPFPFKSAAKLDDQARFQPLSYIRQLADIAKKQNVKIFEKSRVIKIDSGKTCILHTNKGQVEANHVVIATHTPIGFNPIQMFTAPYRSYVVAASLKNENYPDGNFWDLHNPHHAISTHPENDEQLSLMMIAGRHHKTGQKKNSKQCFEELQQYLGKHVEVNQVKHQWSAQHYQSADAIPYIGVARKNTPNILMATGYFADGLVYGTVAAQILNDLLLKKHHKIDHIYRVKLTAGVVPFIENNTNVFFQYLKDYLLPYKHLKNIKKGEGAVVKINGKKCAVYKDNNGNMKKVSAVCTHMAGIVSWNTAEKTWDCPCHGSRFTTSGKVIEGPATKNLEKIK